MLLNEHVCRTGRGRSQACPQPASNLGAQGWIHGPFRKPPPIKPHHAIPHHFASTFFRHAAPAPLITKPVGPSSGGTIHIITQRRHHNAAMPGSGKQNADVQRQIIEFLEAGIDPTTIHRRLKVGRSSIYRMKRCLQQHGTAYAPPETNKKNGRPRVMTNEQEQVSADSIDSRSKTF